VTPRVNIFGLELEELNINFGNRILQPVLNYNFGMSKYVVRGVVIHKQFPSRNSRRCILRKLECANAQLVAAHSMPIISVPNSSKTICLNSSNYIVHGRQIRYRADSRNVKGAISGMHESKPDEAAKFDLALVLETVL